MRDRLAILNEKLEAIESIIVRTLLGESAAERFSAGALSRADLQPYTEIIRELSSAYIEVRQSQLAPVSNIDDAIAYALYFLPINFAKILFLLHELPEDLRIKKAAILDYGAGPGTATLAAAAYFDDISRLDLVDHSAPMREIAGRLCAAAGCQAQIKEPASLGETSTYDIIFASNVLSELREASRLELARSLAKRLNPGGALLILEPALKQPTREAMRTRDLLLGSAPELVPLFPCTRSDNCPMLPEPDNWCHGTLRWEQSRIVTQLDKLLGFNKHRLKYSGFIFQRAGTLRPGLRVLEPADRRKYGTVISVCGPGMYGQKILANDAPESAEKIVKRAAQYERIEIGPGLLKSTRP